MNPYEIVKPYLESILKSLQIIQQWAAHIKKPADFLSDMEGLKTLDAIAYRWQTILLNTQKVEKMYPRYFSKFNTFDVYNLLRYREILINNNDVVDHELIFNLCYRAVPNFIRAVESYLSTPRISLRFDPNHVPDEDEV